MSECETKCEYIKNQCTWQMSGSKHPKPLHIKTDPLNLIPNSLKKIINTTIREFVFKSIKAKKKASKQAT